MVEKIKEFKGWAQAIISSIAGVSMGYFIKVMRDYTKETQVVWIVVAVIFVVIAQKIFEKITRAVIGNSKWIRRMILERHFVEGVWAEEILLVENDKARQYAFAILTIQFVQSDYHMSGRMYDTDFNYVGNFHSDSSHYHAGKLNYFFEGFALHKGTRGVGVGEMIFTQTGKYPTNFSGKLFETRNQDKINLNGIKIADDEMSRLNFENNREVGVFLKKYYEKHGTVLLGRSHSSKEEE